MRAIDADALIHTHKSEQALIGRDWDVNDLDAAIELAPTIDAIPVEWLDAQIRGYASALKSTELKALVLVKQMWQKEQEAR